MQNLDLWLLAIGLIVWAVMTYNRERKARWEKLARYEETLRELHDANLRYYLDVYCGRQSEKDKLIHKPISVN